MLLAMRQKPYSLLLMLTVVVGFSGCASLKKSVDNFNLFSVQDDITLGRKVAQQIESDPKQFPMLPEQGNVEVYNYVRGITQRILNSGQVPYRNQFAWQVKIIKDDKTLNAFCTPGGYIYVYTGLIKFLDSEDQLAGVLGHEIAHAAMRHSTRQMTKIYGLDAVRYVITGKAQAGVLEQIALGLVSLKFGRTHEQEADDSSVRYLCPTNYNASGAAGFFIKLQDKGGSNPPQFLSTHPDPGNRVVAIKGRAQVLKCQGGSTNESEYSRIKHLLD
jgi:predicted Zn-dependent protease